MSLAEIGLIVSTPDQAITGSPASTRLLQIDRVAPSAWDDAIASFDGVGFEQTFAYATARWPNLETEPLLFKRAGTVVGGALMMIQRLPFGLGTYAIAKSAPMLADSRCEDRHTLYRSMIETLIEEYATRRKMIFAFLPRASADNALNNYSWLNARRFVTGPKASFPDHYICDLSPIESDHRKMLGSKWRYHLNHAEKAGLEFEVAPASAFAEFDALYAAMTDRKKFPDYSPYETLPALFKVSAASLRPQIFFVRHGGEAVAGAVIFTAGDTAGYLYGATSEKALPLRAGYFMQWQIMRWLKANSNARWYDLGNDAGFSGLQQFKKGLVGKAGAIVPSPPPLQYADGKIQQFIGAATFILRDLMIRTRDRIRHASGRLAKPDLTATKQS